MNIRWIVIIFIAVAVTLLPTSHGYESENSAGDDPRSSSQSEALTFGQASNNNRGGGYEDSHFSPYSSWTTSTSTSAQAQATTTDDSDEVQYGAQRIGDNGIETFPIAHTAADTVSTDVPTRTINCPGPADPLTGEGVWIDGACTIVCYNNLIPIGNVCTCPPTFELDLDQLRCVCRSPFVECDGKCILKPSQYPRAHNSAHRKRSLLQQVPLGSQVLQGNHVRTELDDKHCPSDEIACRLATGGYHCVEPLNDLEFCGGCPGEGQNCTTLPGVSSAGCQMGQCVVLVCAPTHKLLDGKCVKKSNARKRS